MAATALARLMLAHSVSEAFTNGNWNGSSVTGLLEAVISAHTVLAVFTSGNGNGFSEKPLPFPFVKAAIAE